MAFPRCVIAADRGLGFFFINMPENYSTLLSFYEQIIDMYVILILKFACQDQFPQRKQWLGKVVVKLEQSASVTEAPGGNVGGEWGKLGLRLVD